MDTASSLNLVKIKLRGFILINGDTFRFKILKT